MKEFESFKAAADYARRKARAGQGAMRVVRDGNVWLVAPRQPAVTWHPELDDLQRREGRRLMDLEIAETREFLESIDDRAK